MSPSNLTSSPINGKQVSLLLAKFIGLGMRSTLSQLEWLEYGSGLKIVVMRLEQITRFQMARVVPKLEALEREGGIERGQSTLGYVAVVAALVILSGVLISTGSCNISTTDSMRTLQHEGITNIQLRGYAWGQCGRDDSFSMSFQGSKNGYPVEGALCSGWAKGITVRYK